MPLSKWPLWARMSLENRAGNLTQQPWSSNPAQGQDAALASAPCGQQICAPRTGESTSTGASSPSSSAHMWWLLLLTPVLRCSGFTMVEPTETEENITLSSFFFSSPVLDLFTGSQMALISEWSKGCLVFTHKK